MNLGPRYQNNGCSNVPRDHTIWLEDQGRCSNLVKKMLTTNFLGANSGKTERKDKKIEKQSQPERWGCRRRGHESEFSHWLLVWNKHKTLQDFIVPWVAILVRHIALSLVIVGTKLFTSVLSCAVFHRTSSSQFLGSLKEWVLKSPCSRLTSTKKSMYWLIFIIIPYLKAFRLASIRIDIVDKVCSRK